MKMIQMIALPGNKPNLVGSIQVQVNDVVEKDQVVMTIETGKGNRPIKASCKGVVKKILVNQGDEVVAKQDLIEVEEEVEETSFNSEKTTKETIKKHGEVVVLGGGPGGYVAAIKAAMANKQVVLVEKEHLGGTCLNVGCIPTKTLVSSSHTYETLLHADEFGIGATIPTVNFEKVIERKDRVVSTLRDGISYLMKEHKIEVLNGVGSFVNDTLLKVETEHTIYELTYDDLILATGSKIASVPIPGIDLDVVKNSTTLLDNKELPESLTIIGGGVIGMEFACIYASFGVKVCVIEFLDHILGNTDLETSQYFLDLAKEKGITVHVNSKVESISKTDDGLALVTYSNEGKTHHHVSEMVLVAIGRKPNTDALHLENTSLEVERGAVVVDASMKTNVDHIYAIGDVTNIIQLAHVASHQGMVAVDNILNQNKEMNYNAVPSVIFTNPEIASVGTMGDGSNHYKTAKFNYRSNGKALAMNATEGFIKLVKDVDTNKIVGATIIGADASTLINTITLAINKGCSEEDLIATIFPHPTTGEIIHEAAMGLNIGFIHQ